MIKIKTFIYEGTDLATYNKRKAEMTNGVHYYDLDASKMDKEINNFTEKHKVISVTPVTYIEGIEGSFPVPVIMYTVVYEEAK